MQGLLIAENDCRKDGKFYVEDNFKAPMNSFLWRKAFEDFIQGTNAYFDFTRNKLNGNK